ncbi:MAG: ATP-binding cassette domain-containing protein, partial [Candidatus Korarchaeota archaeon]|nr:ATP-binding cassette domain-containing protein [Candidatus Korarchaeota archaeon]
MGLEVPKRRILAVMGPSGSGKSTLLRAINRLIDL